MTKIKFLSLKAVIDVSTPVWKYAQHYILSDNVYSTFCIDYHHIYAFNQAKSTINVFERLQSTGD